MFSHKTLALCYLSLVTCVLCSGSPALGEWAECADDCVHSWAGRDGAATDGVGSPSSAGRPRGQDRRRLRRAQLAPPLRAPAQHQLQVSRTPFHIAKPLFQNRYFAEMLLVQTIIRLDSRNRLVEI